MTPRTPDPAAAPPTRRAAQAKPGGAALSTPPERAAGKTPSSPPQRSTQEPAAARAPSPARDAGANLNPPEPRGRTAGKPDPEPGAVHVPPAPGPGTAKASAREGRRLAAGASLADIQAAAMTEDRGPDSLDAHVRKLMKDLGLWGYHPLNSIGSRKGWPDWTIIGNRIIYRELKSERGTLRPDQALVRDLILAAGGDWALWRPSDLLSGRIASELTAISRLRVAGGAA